jgi:uncharacterized protein YrrD
VEDLGAPTSYLVLEEGVPVYDRSGERVGVVLHVVADWAQDIFDGLIVRRAPHVGRRRFADVDQIAELRERGVRLSVEADALHRLDGRGETQKDSPLEARLRRALERISGDR